MIKSIKLKMAKFLTKGISQKELNDNLITKPATISGMVVVNSGLEDNYLFDFKNYSSQYNGYGDVFQVGNAPNMVTEGENLDVPTPPVLINTKNAPNKIKIKPVDVLDELEKVPNPFSLTLLDEKIDMLKDKAKLIVQHYAKREVEALIVRLENRKKYSEHREFFDKYQNTTDEHIDKLLEKYDLVMKTSDIFVPEFPDDAIKTMKSYTEAMQKLCDKKPIFYVIAEESKFRKAYEKRDPILLVQSPFGFYWQILGAWDKEMLLLSEL